MRPSIRSLFLLSLAVAPLATAAPKPSAPTSPNMTASDVALDPAAERNLAEPAVLRSQVQELEATLNGMRGELALIREEQDARTRVIGDPNDHPLWP